MADAISSPQAGADMSQRGQKSSPTLNWPLLMLRAMVALVAILGAGCRKRWGVNGLKQRK